MATITGPKVQMPAAASDMFDIIQGPDGAITGINLKTQWATLFHSIQMIGYNLSRSGPTASRPTSSLDGRWIGMSYFDTTLGYPVYLKSVNADVWVNGAGTVV